MTSAAFRGKTSVQTASAWASGSTGTPPRRSRGVPSLGRARDPPREPRGRRRGPRRPAERAAIVWPVDTCPGDRYEDRLLGAEKPGGRPPHPAPQQLWLKGKRRDDEWSPTDFRAFLIHPDLSM